MRRLGSIVRGSSKGRGGNEDAMRIQRAGGFLAAAVLAAFVLAVGSPAPAQKAGKMNQIEADWVAYDAPTQIIKVKVYKVREGPQAKELKAGQDALFNVKAEGSVLTRTTVKVNGKAGSLTDVAAGKRVILYWIPDASQAGSRFARSIDVTFSEEELDERYPDQGGN
jgi:hypothetical protein